MIGETATAGSWMSEREAAGINQAHLHRIRARIPNILTVGKYRVLQKLTDKLFLGWTNRVRDATAPDAAHPMETL